MKRGPSGARVGAEVGAGVGAGVASRRGAIAGLNVIVGARVGAGVGAGDGVASRIGSIAGLNVIVGARVGAGVGTGIGVASRIGSIAGLNVMTGARVGPGVGTGAGVAGTIGSSAGLRIGATVGAGGAVGAKTSAGGAKPGTMRGAGTGVGFTSAPGITSGGAGGVLVTCGMATGMGVANAPRPGTTAPLASGGRAMCGGRVKIGPRVGPAVASGTMPLVTAGGVGTVKTLSMGLVSVITPLFTASVTTPVDVAVAVEMVWNGMNAAIGTSSAFDTSTGGIGGWTGAPAGTRAAVIAGAVVGVLWKMPVGATGALPMCGSGAFFASLFGTRSRPVSVTTTAPFAVPFSTGRAVRLFATTPTSLIETCVCTVTASGVAAPAGVASGLMFVLSTPSCAFGIVTTSLPPTTSTFEPGM